MTLRLILILTLSVVATVGATANDDGKNGRTSRLGDGCGDCHGISVSTATMVTLLGGSAGMTFAPGSTTSFTIRVAHASMPEAGIGIAVVDAMDTGTEVGTLIPGAGLKVKGAAGELVHSAPKVMTDGVADFTFEWTAPETPGTYYVQAIGNAVNGNGEEDDADAWAWMDPMPITVSSTNGVDAEADVHHLGIAPNPCPSGAPFTLSGLPADAERVVLTSVRGEVHYARAIPAGQPSVPLEVPSLPAGAYGVAVFTRSGVVRSVMVVVD